MFKKRKKLLIVFGLFIIFGVAAFFYFKNKNKQVFETSKASVSNLNITVSASGEVMAEKDTNLTFQTGGMLAWVGVKENDQVKQYQAIASLDKRQLQKQFQKIMNDYLTNRWNFEQTQDDYKQTKENKLVTDAIQRVIDKTQFSLNNAVLDAEIYDLTIKFATIYSPFDGVVVSATPKFAGVNISPVNSSYRIMDPRSVYFQTQVDETDVSKIALDDKVEIKLDAYPEETFEGNIKIINFLSTTTSGGGTAYNVWISLPKNENNKFRVGMNGNSEIIAQQLNDILIIPISAIFEKNSKTYVWKIENNKAKQTEVKTGVSNDDNIQIVSGLNENDQIVTSNTSSVKENTQVSK